MRLIADADPRRRSRRGRARKTMVLLEHTAGQGRTLGHRFEHLAAIIEHLDGSPRVGVCLDTCHLVASGYDIVDRGGLRATRSTQFDRLVGFDRLKVFHGNDSKKPCGSRVDRHEHIGDGLPRARAVPPTAARPALRGSADPDRDARRQHGAEKKGAIVADPSRHEESRDAAETSKSDVRTRQRGPSGSANYACSG